MCNPIHVLVLEDQETDAELMIHELRRGGFDPDWQNVDNRADYLAHLDENLDVILADYTLPQFDAMSALRLLQEQGFDIPFIVVTGSISEEVAAECIKQGADNYVLKNHLGRLNPAVERALQDKRLRDEKQLAEAALKESEERYRQIAENSIDGVSIIQDGRMIYVNEAFCRIFGYETGELIGEFETKVVAPESRSLIEERARERIYGKGAPSHYVVRGMTKDGTKLFIEASVSDAFLYKNKPTIVVILRDITEKQRMQEELLRVEKLESIGVLAGGIAHDLNNFLTAILGNVSLAKMYDNLEYKDARIEEAERACMQVKALTQQLLTFSKGGAPIKKPIALGYILRESANFALRGSKCKCIYSLRDDLWSVEVDEAQISQVISNIVINADQAMSEGGLIKLGADNINLRPEDALPLKEGTYIKVSISDQGPGISEANLQRIFDPFFTTKHEGSGLGLATSYSIIQGHDGHMTVESQLGAGAIFHIYLPAFPERTIARSKSKEEKPVMGKGNILVMDDEKYVRDMAAEMLNTLGYKATTAVDGIEAIEMYRNAMLSDNRFDAAIMDLTVPGSMGGKETIQKLIEIDPAVKAIVSSGYSNDPIMANFREHGFRNFIAKPYKVKELSEVLHEVLMKA